MAVEVVAVSGLDAQPEIPSEPRTRGVSWLIWPEKAWHENGHQTLDQNRANEAIPFGQLHHEPAGICRRRTRKPTSSADLAQFPGGHFVPTSLLPETKLPLRPLYVIQPADTSLPHAKLAENGKINNTTNNRKPATTATRKAVVRRKHRQQDRQRYKPDFGFHSRRQRQKKQGHQCKNGQQCFRSPQCVGTCPSKQNCNRPEGKHTKQLLDHPKAHAQPGDQEAQIPDQSHRVGCPNRLAWRFSPHCQQLLALLDLPKCGKDYGCQQKNQFSLKLIFRRHTPKSGKS